MNNLKITYMNVDELVPYENNPRYNDEAVEKVALSIKEFGFKVPIIIDEDNNIIAGHTRLKASKEIGLEEVPCIMVNDLSEEQIKAFRIADNKVSEFAEWDFSLLEKELEEIENINMEDFGIIETNLHSLDIDDFFQDAEEKEKEPKMIKCPHCGEYFEE